MGIVMRVAGIVAGCHGGGGKCSQSFLAEKFLAIVHSRHSLSVSYDYDNTHYMRLAVLIIIFNILYLWCYIYKTKTNSVSSLGF